jgi:hypothetical protein
LGEEKGIKVKAYGLRSMGCLFFYGERQKKTPPTSMRWMGKGCFKVAQLLAHKDAIGVGGVATKERE